MKRRITGFITALLLVVCVWGCVVWRTSYLAGASKAPSTFYMQSSLNRNLPALSFDAVGLGDVLDFLRDVSGNNIDADWTALSRVELDRNTPVSAQARNISFGEVLTLFLPPAKATFYTGDRAILICPADQRPRALNVQRPSPSHGPYDGTVRMTIPSLQFDEVKLGDVLDFFRQTQGAPINVDWQSLNAAGVNKGTPITFVSRNRSFASSLSQILGGCSEKGEIQFQVRAEGIFVATREEFDRREVPARWWQSIGIVTTAAIGGALVIILVAWRLAGGKMNAAGEAFEWGIVCLAILLALGVGFATWRHGAPFWEYVHDSTRLTLTADHGAIHLFKSPADPAMPFRHPPAKGTSGRGVVTVKGKGGLYVRQSSWPAAIWELQVPAWAVVAGSGLGPLVWVVARLRRRRRLAAGKCRQCGYDLRTSKERCPECGAAIVA